MVYYRIQQVLDSIIIAKCAGMKTMTFDWNDIHIKKRRYVLKLCRKHGKVKRTRYGFVIYL